MEARALKRFEKLTPSKANIILDEIRRKNAKEIMLRLQFSKRRSSQIILKILKSAVSNAKQKDAGLDDEDLYIKTATATRGYIMKRVLPRSRGTANTLKIYTSHITIVVSDEAPRRKR